MTRAGQIRTLTFTSPKITSRSIYMEIHNVSELDHSQLKYDIITSVAADNPAHEHAYWHRFSSV